MSSILGFQAPLLRLIAEQLGLQPVAEIARQPSTHAVYRITAHYFDGRVCSSVATLRESLTEGIVLEVAYQRALLRKPLRHLIDDERYARFVKALKSIQFDHMGDHSALPAYLTTDLWMVERAAGTFSHSVILAPELVPLQRTNEAYGKLVNAVRNGLPEALRQVK